MTARSLRRVALLAAALLVTTLPVAPARAQDPAPAPVPLVIDFSASSGDGDVRTSTVGTAPEIRYGTAWLSGSGTADGIPVDAMIAGALLYHDGSGPYTGTLTFTWPNGDLLALELDVITRAGAGQTTVAAALSVLGGTGSLAAVTGAGTMDGYRDGGLGTITRYRVELLLSGMPEADVLMAAPADPIARTFADPAATGEELFRAYGDLMIAKDLVALDALLDPAFMIARADGSFAVKADYLARLPDVRSFGLSEVTESRSSGGVTVRLLVQADLTVDGKRFLADPVPQLVTFRWEGIRWRLVSQANFSRPAS